MGEIFCGGRKCTTTSCELKMWAGFYTREEKGRALGCPSSLRLPPSCLGTSKQGSLGGRDQGPNLPHLLLFCYTELWWVSDSQVF